MSALDRRVVALACDLIALRQGKQPSTTERDDVVLVERVAWELTHLMETIPP